MFYGYVKKILLSSLGKLCCIYVGTKKLRQAKQDIFELLSRLSVLSADEKIVNHLDRIPTRSSDGFMIRMWQQVLQ